MSKMDCLDLYLSEQCGHCRRFMEGWDQLKRDLRRNFPKLEINLHYEDTIAGAIDMASEKYPGIEFGWVPMLIRGDQEGFISCINAKLVQLKGGNYTLEQDPKYNFAQNSEIIRWLREN